MNVEDDEKKSSKDLMNEARRIEKKYRTVEEEDAFENEVAWGDVSGAALDPKEVRRARNEEIDYIKKMSLYEKVLVGQCYTTIGNAPVSIRWIDINTGDQENPNYKSRIVAREINTYRRDDLFAAAPLLEALNVILSMTATSNRGEVVMTNDISRAFFHARVKRDVFVQLPNEDVKEGEHNMCGKLK